MKVKKGVRQRERGIESETHTHTFKLFNTLMVISVCDVQRPRGETAEKKEMMMNKCVNYREQDVKLHTHTRRGSVNS